MINMALPLNSQVSTQTLLLVLGAPVGLQGFRTSVLRSAKARGQTYLNSYLVHSVDVKLEAQKLREEQTLRPP